MTPRPPAPPRETTDEVAVARDQEVAALRKAAIPRLKCAEHDIRAGMSAEWVAMKYGLSLELMQRWRARHLQLVEEAKKAPKR